MFPFDVLSNPKVAAGTLYLRYFGFTKIPMLAFVRPSVVDWTDERIELRIPLSRRTKNHLGCMYFAALAAGADLAAGFLAMQAIRQGDQAVSLIFKNLHADFLKRAEGDVHFTCDQGVKLKRLVDKAIKSGERVEMAVPVIATVPRLLRDEPVAKFKLTLSLKKKEAKSPF